MAKTYCIVGASGSGKSTSLGKIEELGIIGLNPAETAIINVMDKPLPFKGSNALYNVPVSKGGNYAAVSDGITILKVLASINARPEIKNVVIDDFQYIMSEEFMAKALKAGFEKFNKLAKNAYDVLNMGINMKEDTNFIIMTHSESKETSFDTTYKMKTIGNMLDNKVTLEGLFTILLYAKQTWDDKEKKVSKFFVTNYDGQYPAKTPVGMFKETYILNDLGLVLDTVQKYHNGE